jgi:glucan 1,3-beta-glucosidase
MAASVARTHPMNLPIPNRRRASVLLTLLAAVSMTLLWWIGRGRPAEPPDLADTRLACVSYAPFRLPGETPFDRRARVSETRIEADLRILRERAGCVRTYSVSQGLDAVPAVARRLGLRVKLGAWVGRDAAQNAEELALAIDVARRSRDVVELLIVGNEVLLRQEQPPQALAALLERARREARVPVSYADVWEFWFRNEALREHVDVVTVHILPYWEDHPVGIDAAVDHVFSIASIARERFAGKPLLIGETGWPAAGRQRDGAVPGRVEQARFVREFVERAGREPVDYNLIEGFDQPWKRALEGAMGGYWGLFDSAGEERFPWSGPVVEDPAWHRGPLLATVGAAVALVWGTVRGRRAAGLAAVALGWSAAATLALAHWQSMLAWSRTPLEWAVALLASAAALGCTLLGTSRLADALGAGTDARLDARRGAALGAPVPGIVRALVGPAHEARALGLSRAALLFAAASIALLLVADPRYRGFPWALLLGPTAVLVALRICGDATAADAREERLLGAVVAACAPVIAWIEGPSNAQAAGFSVLLLVLGAAVAWPAGYRGGRAYTSAASKAAGTEASAE